MDWNIELNMYCERLSSGFFAEPLNLYSNAAFLIAAFLAWRFASQQAPATGPAAPITLLCILLALIGIGSALFHSFATVWAMWADVVPIAVFILTYIGICYRLALHANTVQVITAYLLFASLTALGSIYIDASMVNDSQNYFGAVAMVFVISWHAWRQRHPSRLKFFVAGFLICASLLFRAIDQGACEQFAWGTHFLWHILNSIALYLLTTSLVVDDKPKKVPN